MSTQSTVALATGQQGDYLLQFDIGTIKHLGLQMYSTLPPVIGELVSNAWDADASFIEIAIPEDPVGEDSEITVRDDGIGMTDEDVRNAYLVVGRDRREVEGDQPTAKGRRIMGRKGIGKFSAFGIAGEIEVESTKDGETSRFKIDYDEMKKHAAERELHLPRLAPTGALDKGTLVTLRQFKKFRNRRIPIPTIRRGLARRFSIIGEMQGFQVVVNGKPITPDERDLERLLERDADGKPYIWTYQNVSIELDTDWTVSGWIGALDRTSPLEDGIQRGIVIMARGKLVQEPFVFDAVVGQQFALSYVVGELHAEFVDMEEDTIGTTRNSLVWDTEANAEFKKWGQNEVNRIAREWAQKRSQDNARELERSQVYAKFKEQASKIGNRRAEKLVDKLVKGVISRNPTATVEDQERVIQMGLDFLEFDAFWDLAEQISETNLVEAEKLTDLFREWEIVEAKEMMRITEGRIATIRQLQQLIDQNALEVPTLHNFLKEFPWVLDPRWTLVDDEVRFSDVLRKEFPDDDLAEEDRRIDFLCVGEDRRLVVVEIKRPKMKASVKELDQIRKYVYFMRDFCSRTTDWELRAEVVNGYLLVGDRVDTYETREGTKALEKDGIYVRRYSDLLRMVEAVHDEFLKRFERLRDVKSKALPAAA